MTEFQEYNFYLNISIFIIGSVITPFVIAVWKQLRDICNRLIVLETKDIIYHSDNKKSVK